MVAARAGRSRAPSTADGRSRRCRGGQEPGGGDERGAARAAMLIRNMERQPRPEQVGVDQEAGEDRAARPTDRPSDRPERRRTRLANLLTAGTSSLSMPSPWRQHHGAEAALDEPRRRRAAPVTCRTTRAGAARRRVAKPGGADEEHAACGRRLVAEPSAGDQAATADAPARRRRRATGSRLLRRPRSAADGGRGDVGDRRVEQVQDGGGEDDAQDGPPPVRRRRPRRPWHRKACAWTCGSALRREGRGLSRVGCNRGDQIAPRR